MKWICRGIAIFFLLSFTGSVTAQQIDSLMEVYNAKVPQEKVYVQFDNNLYTPGQTIWYKAYLFTGIDPFSPSKTLYVDWFDNQGKLVQRVTAPVLNSSASGSFSVPQNFKGNNLRVLAYTKWMLNFDSSFFYHRTIPVMQPETQSLTDEGTVPVPSLRFFPEGGDMIEGLRSNVAFKALSGGLPVSLSGKINNRKGVAVAEFRSAHNGMGKFMFTPEPGEAYTAEWKDARGTTQYTELPAVRTTGIILTLKNNRGNWSFDVERPAKEDKLNKVMLVASMYQQILFRASINLSSKTKVSSSIPTDKFPSGVLRLTVMDMSMKPLAERVIFVDNSEYLADAKVSTDTLNTNQRGKNVFEIDWPDTTSASLSLAITDAPIIENENIISGLLLSSEIKGNIFEPAYYFSSNDDSVTGHLDLVMMTHGWRRFAWEQVMAGITPPLLYRRDSTYLSIAGKIDNMSEARLKKAEMLNMVVLAKDSSRQLIFTPLSADGSFHEDNMVLFDTVKIFYQLNKSFIPAKSKINIGNNFIPFDSTKKLDALERLLPDTTGMARLQFLAREQKRMDSLKASATLKEVVVKTRVKTRIEEMNDLYTSSLFKTTNAREFDLVNDPVASATPNIFAYLASRVAGLVIANPYSENPSASRRGQAVSLFLNEMPVDASGLAMEPVSNIAYVKVIAPPFFGAPGGGPGGAIAVYTKRGGDGVRDMKGMDYTLLPGYTAVKEFYVADPSEAKGAFPRADLRRTLYWNPNIMFDAANKKARVVFYNNDISNTMQIVLEGVADDGRLVHYTKLLK